MVQGYEHGKSAMHMPAGHGKICDKTLKNIPGERRKTRAHLSIIRLTVRDGMLPNHIMKFIVAFAHRVSDLQGKCRCRKHSNNMQ
jgi:hypothetical protein